MSWKHIFRAARRMDTPVIITNEEGERPLVVMPLSSYESMLDTELDDFDLDFGGSEGLDPEEIDFEDELIKPMRDYENFSSGFEVDDFDPLASTSHKTASPGPQADSAFEAMPEPISEPFELPGFDIQDNESAGISQNVSKSPVDNVPMSTPISDSREGEISLEDSFIFESLDENQIK